MSITKHIIPATYSAGYSPIPLRFSSSNVATSDKLNYLANVVYNQASIDDIVTFAFGDYTYAKVITTTPNVFKIGDSIIIDDSANTDAYTGFYDIVKIIDSTNFVINLTLGPAYGAGVGLVYNYISYKSVKDLDDEAKLQLEKTLCNFVTQDLQDVNEIFTGDNTAFEYDVLLGDEYDFFFEFQDNGYFFDGAGYGDAGKISFYKVGATASDLPFEIGDAVVVQQDLFEWSYADNFFDTGDLGFTNSVTFHNFRPGQTVTVTGQVTEPYYNGVTSIKSVDNYPASNSLTTNKTFTTVTGAEPGIITGVPVPEYNSNCRIVDINDSATYGVVISTNMSLQQATQPIGGKITYNNTLLRDLNAEVVSGRKVYNAYIDKLTYGKNIDSFDGYVIQNRDNKDNNISTILDDDNYYRVEHDSKFWLLTHTHTDVYAPDSMFTFWDVDDNILSVTQLTNATTNLTDYYTPCGVNQLIASANTTLISGSTLSSVVEDIYRYSVTACNTSGTVRSNPITFEINEDCSKYEKYHLMWKDSCGSWITFPFIYLSDDTTEVEKKNFYKKEETWDTVNNTFGYDSFGRGETTFFSRGRDKITVSSGWMNEFEDKQIKDLIISSAVYCQLPDGTLLAVQVEKKSQRFNKKNIDYRWTYQFVVRLSRDEIRL